MKVIGKTPDGYILEASEEDAFGIQGMYKFEKGRRLEVGDEIDIAGLFHRYHSVSIALNDINKLSQTATLLINTVDWVQQFMEGPKAVG